MSAPPAGNPDRRPLPDGWITRYDENYRAWYYVDTRAQPPRSSWDHPLGTLPPSSPPGYAPPPNPPSRNYANSGGTPSFNQQQGQPYPLNQSQSYPGAFQGNPQDPRAYPQQGFPPQQGYGGHPPGNYGNPGWQHGWQQPQQAPIGYAQPPSQAIQQPARSGGGRNNMLLAGGAGLLGGALLGGAFEHHEEEERQEAYDQGFGDGQDGDYGGGGDFGGGDF